MAISEAMARAILGHRSDEVALVLLTITSADFTTIRVVNDGVDITSNGNTFLKFPFVIDLPGDGEGLPIARLQIQNVSRQIWEAIEAATATINVKIEVILASAPDTIEKSFDGLELRNVVCNALTVEGELTTQQFTAEPYPHIRAIPSRLPGLFFD
jgi:Domain of unknown function (DUF1833)